MKPKALLYVSFLFVVFLASLSASQGAALRFRLSFPEARSRDTQEGRLLLLISSDDSAEPRFQISDSVRTQLVFGIDVEGLKPGEKLMATLFLPEAVRVTSVCFFASILF